MPQISASFTKSLILKVENYANKYGLSKSQAIEVLTLFAFTLKENPYGIVSWILSDTASFMKGLTKQEHANFIKRIKLENVSLLKEDKSALTKSNKGGKK